MQAFRSSVRYEIAGQGTGDILMLVVLNTTLTNSSLASDVPFNVTHSRPPGKHLYRRYMEMQAAAWDIWVCHKHNLSTTSMAQQAAWSVWPVTDHGLGPDWVLLDSSQVRAAALASGRDAREVKQLLWAVGCQYLQSFVLVDIKWVLQAQVSERHPCSSTAGLGTASWLKLCIGLPSTDIL